LEAGTDSPKARAALETMCERYHPPVLAYLQLRGLASETAEDLAQDFFANLVAGDELKAPENIRGSFTSYLRKALENRLRMHLRAGRAAKRGGGLEHRSIESDPAVLHESPLVQDLDAADLFDRICIRHHFDLALETLEQRYRERGKQERFTALKPFLADHGDYDTASTQLGMGRDYVRVAVKRLRDDFRSAFAALAADTAGPEQQEEEVRRWFQSLSEGAGLRLDRSTRP
jgi:RNA polymerase sigma-70 factor (ECF subfamily)